jgi:hypothetical protein
MFGFGRDQTLRTESRKAPCVVSQSHGIEGSLGGSRASCRRLSSIWSVADDDVGPANQNLCDESARIAAMKPILDHLDRIVRPCLRRYAEAEAALTKAHAAQDQAAIGGARIEAGLAARQAVVTTKDGAKRALSSVLQNVFDAWTLLLGLPQKPINEF